MGDVFLQGCVMEYNTREQWFSPQGDFAPRRHLSLSGDIFVCHSWGLWLLLDFVSRGQGCSKPSTMHRTGPHNKESSGPHANSPEVEKPCHKDMLTFLMYFFFLHFCPWSQFSLSHLIQPPSLSPVDLTAPSPSYQDINNLGKVLMAAEAKAPILWPPDAKSWLIGKDLGAGKDWRQKDKGVAEDEMIS